MFVREIKGSEAEEFMGAPGWYICQSGGRPFDGPFQTELEARKQLAALPPSSQR